MCSTLQPFSSDAAPRPPRPVQLAATLFILTVLLLGSIAFMSLSMLFSVSHNG